MDRPRLEMPAMAAYGVVEDGWSPLPWSWAADRLVATRNFWLVTASSEGRPHALPVWGVWSDDELRFGFSCAPTARKARNLRDNPACVVATDDTVECISVEGRAELVDVAARVDVWVERYLAKYRPIEPNLSGEFLRANLLFEMQPERAFGVIERADEFAARATRWAF